MRRQPVTIICDATRRHAPSASSQGGDRHDLSGHHRYYGSSATNGGERIVHDRRGARANLTEVFGFPL